MKILFRLFVVSLSFFLLFMVVRIFLFDWYVVGSNSMLPTLKSGDVVFVSKLSKIRRNDMAVFYLNDNVTAVVKRCVAVPGDTIGMENGYFRLANGGQTGLLQSQKRLSYMSEESGAIKNFDPIYLPKKKESNPQTKEIYAEDYYYFCGDNLTNSIDSRNYGPVASNQIEGRIIFVLGL
ncbi:MAG: signal peptidase I [Bacteroidales bacterium]|nr:signal peptidase I [Bacteroidales bacterium]